MSENPWLQDLPAIRADDLDLPVLSPTSGPQHQPASVLYPGWFNLASQLHINAIAIHPLDGTIWLATAGGVLRWSNDQSTFTRYGSEHGLPGNAIAHLAIDTSGQGWAASETNVSYFDGEVWQSYFSIHEQSIHCMTCSNAGTIHITAGSNVYTLTTIRTPYLLSYPCHWELPCVLLR